MYDNETEFNSSQSQSFCNVCLCRNRRTVPLGEYAGIFNRVTGLSAEENHNMKLCWECLAVLKKIKVFETKCFIAQKILHGKWGNHQQPRCLSTLATTPLKIETHIAEETNNHGFKEAKPLVYPRTNPNILCENYMHNEGVLCAKSEQNVLSDDGMDNLSESKYACFARNTTGNDYLKKELEESNLNKELNFNVAVLKTDERSENFDSKELDLSKEIHFIKKSSVIKLNKNDNVRRKGLRKKDLEEHFRIVQVSPKELKRFRSRCKIEGSELEFWRETEKLLDCYVERPYKCHSCICAFSSVKKKFEHDKKYHDITSGDYSCDVCNSQFPSKQQLVTHVSRHNHAHRCDLCQFRCLSRHVIKRHMSRHKRVVTCAHCDACFSNVNLFHKHYKSNHSVFICDHCGKRCRTKYTLEKHMRHHSEKNVCLICNKIYASRNSLRNHSEMKHKQTSGEMSYCVKCDKQFPNVPLYRRHVQTSQAHAAERDADRNKKQVSCPICGNVYSRKTYMMNHYRHVHMKQSKHYCTDCDRHFLNRTRYVEHRKYHHEGETKAKNKMCNICGRGFAANRTLMNHIRTHSGERPYECQYCDAKFTQKHGMLSHIKYIHMKSKRRGFQ